MSKTNAALKGYIKTENVILLIAIAMAVGFVGGVTFSVYRSTRSAMLSGDAQSPQMTPQQKEQIANLVARTEKNPEDVDAWTHLGHLYFDTGQPDLAIESYEKSLRIDGNRPDVWTDLGVMYRRTGKPQKAIESFDRALISNPNHEIAMYNKGVVLMHDMQDPAGALSAWENLVAINPNAKTPTGEPLNQIIQQLKQTLSTEQKRPKS